MLTTSFFLSSASFTGATSRLLTDFLITIDSLSNFVASFLPSWLIPKKKTKVYEFQRIGSRSGKGIELSSDQAISNKLKTMGSGHHRQDGDKGLFSHLVGAGRYAPQVAYPAHAYPYPPPVGYPPSGYHHHGGYPPHVCPPPGGYPPVGYPASSAPYYSGHGRHGHGVGTFIAGGAAAVAAAYGAHHNYGSHGYGYYGYHHGKYKHGKFKRAKFGKRWKRGWVYGKHKW
ncbi:hypothetical protein L2E82_39590 [Cichorium intybus]|uniref:Uncharacterized protein n=1 Tax=Cichorium intybus TaxID=13427 RepID=A0ACB9AJE5_CICIN|nr:hypothetical protein L2E82_39590 [Cichorium intybus]